MSLHLRADHTPEPTADTRPRMRVRELIAPDVRGGRHAADYREPLPGVYAVRTVDGAWGLWVREGTGADAVAARWADLAHPDDAARVYAAGSRR